MPSDLVTLPVVKTTVPIDANEALLRYDYDPETGLFTRKRTYRQYLAGTVVTGGRGRVKLRIGGKQVQASRVAWTLLYGPVPEGMEVDHINGDDRDNRPENLRLATYPENGRNRGVQRNNRLGVKGVTRAKAGYKAHIKVLGKHTYLGYFSTIEEADQAYKAAADLHFKEFARK